MKTVSLTRPALLSSLIAAGVIGGAAAGLVSAEHAHALSPAVASVGAPVPSVAPVPAAATLPDFRQIAAQRGAAVVHISVSGMTRVSANDEENDGPDLQGLPPGMSEFFRRFGMTPMRPDMQPMPVRGQGSGFIVGSDGVILTNAHVVKGAKEVTVKLADRREFPAKVLGSDEQTDVAVIKIDAKGLPTLPLGDSKDLQAGEWVLAIGSPFGFEHSVTAGIVSATSRSLPGDGFVPFIQTDVAVNPGNSGGPLFNARGEVVGINSQIFSRTGGYEGLSFAIPIDVAVRVKDQIVSTGHATHARLGVSIQEVNQGLADSFGLPKPEGALVASVVPGSAAEGAGLKAGDVILKADDQAITTSGDLPAFVGRAKPGQTVALEVWRQGERKTLEATLGDAKDTVTASADDEDSAGPVSAGKLGLMLRPLAPQEQQQAEVDGGLVVQASKGAAARAGVRPGDVLLAINGKPVEKVDQARELIAGSKKSVALLVQRDGQRIFIPVHVG
jgi:serine protease Do